MYKTIEGRYGPVTFLEKDMYVGKSLYYYGEYGPDESEMIVNLARDTCLDIGANIGCISQALVSAGKFVEAFEPQPEIFKLLRQNVHCFAHNVGVSNRVGFAKMPKLHYSSKFNYGGVGLNESSIYGTIEVPLVTIDSLNITDVGFMKIDVEGHELEVLEGAAETISLYRPILYVEDDRVDKSRALRQYIAYLGYSIEEHKPTLYREDNFFGLKRNVWDKNYATHNLICRHVND